MLTIAYLPLEQEFKDYSGLDQAVADFEFGLNSILTDSVKTVDLDASIDEHDTMPSSSVSSGFLCLVYTLLIIIKCSLILTLIHINCGARLGCYYCLYSLVGKISDSKLICYFFSHSTIIWFLCLFTTG